MRIKGQARARGKLLAVAVPLLLLLSACSEKLPQDALDPQGPIARKQDDLWDLTIALAAIIFVIVEALIVFAVIKFRRRSENDVPKQIHGNPVLEISLTILPAVLLAIVAVPTVSTIFDLSERPKGDVLDVDVTGRQFWWEFSYPGLSVRTANELHIPVDRPVYLALHGPDVLHSFWPPKLAGKRDVHPGRTNHMIIEADKPGTYFGQCAEFCGLSHANMRLRVIAQEPEDFDAWLAAQRRAAPTPQPGEAADGAQLFVSKQCFGCHAIKGVSEAKMGPNLTHLKSRKTFAAGTFKNTPENLAEWLRDPPKMKPGVLMPNLGLTEEEITKLVAYLETLK